MSDLDTTLAASLAGRFTACVNRICELAAPLNNTQFWTKPLPYGNSFGHLVLHLTGNLNYYIGAQIAATGYVRDRPREFAESTPPSKEETLKGLSNAVAMVVETIHAQASTDWMKDYSAVGTDCNNRLDMTLRCAAHMHHHIGQMIYLVAELQRQAGS